MRRNMIIYIKIIGLVILGFLYISGNSVDARQAMGEKDSS
jgi:hypothetical protein